MMLWMLTCSGHEMPPAPSHACSPDDTNRTRYARRGLRQVPLVWLTIATQMVLNLWLKPARVNTG